MPDSKPATTRKPSVGSDPTRGSRTKLWQVGLYAFAGGASLVLLAVNLALIINGSFSRVGAVLWILVSGLSWGLLSNNGDSFEAPTGLLVNNAEPSLVAFVEEVAAAVNAPMPDEIHLVTEADIALVESTKFFALKVDKSVLAVGLPYVRALTKGELAALLGHELAHYGEHGIEHGARAFRALESAERLIAIERKGVMNGVFGSYARKMYRSIGGVGVAQEQAADRAVADAFGTETMLTALTKYDDVAVAFDQLLRHYVVPALQRQARPEDMFGGFGELLASHTRRDERVTKVETRRHKERGDFELHRTARERLATVESWSPISAEVRIDDGGAPAYSLLDPAAKSSEIVVGKWASNLMIHRTEPRSWDELAAEVYSIKTHTLASRGFADHGHDHDLEPGPDDDDAVDPTARFELVLSMAEDQDWNTVDEALAKKPATDRTAWVEAVVTEAAAAAEGTSWEHNWDGPPRLLASTGEPFDARPIAALAVAGEAAAARSALAQLL